MLTLRRWILLGVLIAVLGTPGAWLNYKFGMRALLGARRRELTSRHFESTPARIARGRYLVEGVAHCFGCHSPFEGSDPVTGAPPAGQAGSGDFVQVGAETLVIPNLTPDSETGIGSRSDDELARAIREGIGYDGRALMPIMPYRHFRKMSDEDLAAIVVYLRSLPAVRHVLPARKLSWRSRLKYQQYPQPVLAPVLAPNTGDAVSRGAYYVELGKCRDCHSPLDEKNNPRAGLDLAGGTFLDEVNLATPNLTRDATGISYYDAAMFIGVMRTGKVGARQLNPIMPWWYIGHMSDEDLRAIFAYLQSVPPVRHRVDNALPKTYCPLCRQWHGGGEQNSAVVVD